ncbi:MAG TPA: S49 family peptidase [Chryseolinea sp.]|nr:S49 family peptidase [Chryseolinea sp.]
MIDILSYRQWAISHQFASRTGAIVLGLLAEGKSIDNLIKKTTQEKLLERYSVLPVATDGLVVSTSWDPDAGLVVARTQTGANVAIIPVIGALTKRGDLCSYGMRDYTRMLDRAVRAESISAIVMDIESPGGTVDGTNEFGLAISAAKERKPVVAFGDGMVASAAYWIASQASEIIGNKNNATEFGSIGVLCVYENYQAYIQKEIGAVEIIRAPQSTDKARINSLEPLTDDLREQLVEELRVVAEDFFSTVKQGRGSRLNTGEENIFTGKMYPASKALTLGMIDGLDTLQGAINRSAELASKKTNTALVPLEEGKVASNKTMKIAFVSTLFSSLFGKSESADTSVAFDAAAADAKVVEMEALVASLQASAAAAAATIAGLNEQIKTMVSAHASAMAELQKKVDEAPTGSKTTVIPGKSEESAATDPLVAAKSFRTKHDDEADKLVTDMGYTLKK